MAIVKFGEAVTGIRGTVGGSIYSANKAGPYVRTWAQGANPRSTLQNVQRAQFAALGAAWRAITPAQQAGWDTFAANVAQIQTNSLGETYYLSGWQWFCKCNSRLAWVQRSTQVTAPAAGYPSVPLITDFKFWYYNDVFEVIHYFTAGDFDGYDFIVYTKPFISDARGVAYSDFRLINYDKTLGAADFRVYSQTEFQARYGLPQDGYKCFSRVFKQSTEGLRSPVYSIDQTCTHEYP